MNKQLTPMQDLKQHIQNMVDNGGDYDLLCVIGMIDSKYLPKEKQVIEDAYTSKCYFESCADKKQGCKCGQDYYNNKFKNY